MLWRYVAFAVFALALLITLKTVFFSRGAEPRWLTAPAKAADIEETVLASGVLRPSKVVDVGAQVSGQIRSLNVALGDHVARGELIATIDPATQRNALLIARAGLDQQRAERRAQEAVVEQDRLQSQREAATLAAEASSRQEEEAADAALKGAEAKLAAIDAQIRQASLSVDTAKVNLGYTKIVAPMDGVVIAAAAEKGQTVNAVQSAPTIVKLADLQTMTVKAQISEADVVRVRPGQSVYFTILGDPDHRYLARLQAIEPAPEAASSLSSTTGGPSGGAVYYDGLFETPNADGRLRPGMTAEVSIVLASARHVLTIPSAALTPTGVPGRATVRVLEDPGVQPSVREVRVGINNAVTAQVLSGLREGEQVVIGRGGASGGADSTPRARGA